MIHLLQTAVLDFGLLISIFARSDVDDDLNEPDSILFQFEHGVLQIWAVAEDDSIAVSIRNTEVGFLSISEQNPWALLIGGKVTAAWVLKNNYAFEDGVEFEVSLATGDQVLLRLLVIASTIHACVVPVTFVSWVALDG